MVTIVPQLTWQPDLTPHGGPLYRALADALAADVAAGRVAAGTRLPTHRELAERLGVTVGTVTRGYAEAARRGLVSGEVGRGTFVTARAPTLAPGAAPGEPDLVDLSRNEPPLPAGEAAGAALRATLGALSERPDLAPLLGYPSEAGEASQREAGAEWICAAGLDARPEDVLVSSGGQHAVATVLATLLQPGDLVLAEALTYPGLRSVAGLLHLRLQGLVLDEEGVRPDALEAACRGGAARALYCVPTLHNPTTAVMSVARRQALAEIARRHDLVVVEDDIHARLLPGAPPPLARFAPERTCYIASLSKTLVPALRLGYVRAPAGLAERLVSAVRATTWAASPLLAEIARGWIRDGTAETMLAERRREAAERQSLASDALAGTALRAHPAAYHAWLPLPEPWRADAFVACLARRGVAVTPAEAFVVGRAPAPHAVRLGLGAPRSHETLARGLRIVAEVLAAPQPGEPAVV